MSIQHANSTNTLNVRCIKDSHTDFIRHQSCPFFTPRDPTEVPYLLPTLPPSLSSDKIPNRLNPLCIHFNLTSYTHLYGFCALDATREHDKLNPPSFEFSEPRRLTATLSPEEAQTRSDAIEDAKERNGTLGRKPVPK